MMKEIKRAMAERGKRYAYYVAKDDTSYIL